MLIFTLSHKRILVIRRRKEILFNRAGGGPADQVQQAAGFVVGAGGSAAAEWLLAYYGAGRFVVDIEITGGVAQGALGQQDCVAVSGEDRSGESVRRGMIAQVQCLGELVIIVDENRDHRAEYLFLHQLEIGIGRDHDCWLDKPPFGAVVIAAGDKLSIG